MIPTRLSCPGLTRASSPPAEIVWMAGSSPAMTAKRKSALIRQHQPPVRSLSRRCRRSAAQPGGACDVDLERRGVLEDDPVVDARALDGDEPVLDVPRDALDRPVEGIAVAAAARVHVGGALARLDRLDDVLLHHIDLPVAPELDAADLGL